MIEGNIKQVTIKRKNGKWYAIFAIERVYPIFKFINPRTHLKTLQYIIIMHASCMNPMNVDLSLSHLIASLLNPPVIHAKIFQLRFSYFYRSQRQACMVFQAWAYAYSSGSRVC